MHRIPWYAKIAAKLVLSRMPAGYSFWRRMSLFRHGSMHRGDYAWSVFSRHLGEFMTPNGLAGKRILELGPGDGITSGLLASIFGAEHTTLVDVGDFATRDLEHYRPMLHDWASRGHDVSALLACAEFDELCAAGRTTYLTAGLDSLRGLETSGFDVVFSNAVLEHVRRSEFRETIEELWRVLSTDGLSSHEVDLRDHLGGALNNLRFSEKTWESEFFASSGFYTNRIRFEEMLAVFANAGFDAEVTEAERWDELPTPRRKLNPQFRGLPDADLLTATFDVVARKSS